MKINRNNKFHKHQIFMKDTYLRNYLPETMLLTKENLLNMQNKYKKFVIKPSIGSLGKGIIIVSEVGREKYELFILNRIKNIVGQSNLYTFLKGQETHSIQSIVQKYIPLATYTSRSIDFRYIVQRTDTEWVVTGKYAKVAKDGYAVTNFEYGSSILTVEEALMNTNINHLNLDELLETLEIVTLSISNCLYTYFPSIKIWGCDIGIDIKGNIWIIEANSAPQTKGFLEIEALKPMYNTIESYKRKYKRKT
ncbi:YheC/YheD family protein [Bacillus sp. J37]|uniref:YheC/YheD family protein n=1 Tax=Bacillus sp. J37 TaxID=935837 RepID=UPI00047DD2B6|nr:YheC/YheD family protein [Bacillus sp. J37]